MTQAPVSTTASRAAALTMFAGNVPCVFSLSEPSCPNPARWLALFAHEENTTGCEHDEPWPVCETHKKQIQIISHPFWRVWNNLQPIPCTSCQSPLRLNRFDPI
jgi:hypothetical protein